MKKIDQRIQLLETTVINALEDLKAQNIVTLDIRKLSSIADTMVICSGNSNRHVKSIADNVASKAKEKNFQVIGMEGELEAEWVLIDLGDILVHVMQQETRDFYNLEKLWGMSE